MKTLLATLALAMAMASTPVHAGTIVISPTVRVQSGSTTLRYDALFQGTLAGAGITSGAGRPAVVVPGAGNIVRLPVTWGAFTLTDLRGEIFHSGGIVLRSPTVRVSLSDFILETPQVGGSFNARISALVTVNGSLQGRVQVFDLDLSGSGLVPPLTLPASKTLRINRIAVSLSADGAAALNLAFSVSAFSAGQAVGTINTRLITRGRF